MSKEEKLLEASRLETQAKKLRFEAIEEERLTQKRKESAFKENFKLDVYTSDDYCGLEAGIYEFYYGYEESFCPTHGMEDCYGRFNCPEKEWAFTAKVDGKEILRLPKSKLHPVKDEEPFWYLVAGIGHFLIGRSVAT